MTPRLGICLIDYPGKVSGGSAFTLAEMAVEAVTSNLGVFLDRVTEQPVDRARNVALQNARQHECAYLVMMDADVYVEPGQSPVRTLLAGLRNTDAVAIGAVVAMRGRGMVNTSRWEPDSEYSVDRVGSGLLLIDLHRLDAMGGAGPWFRMVLSDDGAAITVSEDFYFCRKVTGYGGIIAASTRLHTRHDETKPLQIERFTVRG